MSEKSDQVSPASLSETGSGNQLSDEWKGARNRTMSASHHMALQCAGRRTAERLPMSNFHLGGDSYLDGCVSLVDGFDPAGQENFQSLDQSTIMLNETDNDFGHFRLETSTPLSLLQEDRTRRKEPDSALDPSDSHTEHDHQTRPFLGNCYVSSSAHCAASRSRIPVKTVSALPTHNTRPPIAPKPTHLSGKVKEVQAGCVRPDPPGQNENSPQIRQENNKTTITVESDNPIVSKHPAKYNSKVNLNLCNSVSNSLKIDTVNNTVNNNNSNLMRDRNTKELIAKFNNERNNTNCIRIEAAPAMKELIRKDKTLEFKSLVEPEQRKNELHINQPCRRYSSEDTISSFFDKKCDVSLSHKFEDKKSVPETNDNHEVVMENKNLNESESDDSPVEGSTSNKSFDPVPSPANDKHDDAILIEIEEMSTAEDQYENIDRDFKPEAVESQWRQISNMAKKYISSEEMSCIPLYSSLPPIGSKIPVLKAKPDQLFVKKDLKSSQEQKWSHYPDHGAQRCRKESVFYKDGINTDANTPVIATRNGLRKTSPFLGTGRSTPCVFNRKDSDNFSGSDNYRKDSGVCMSGRTTPRHSQTSPSQGYPGFWEQTSIRSGRTTPVTTTNNIWEKTAPLSGRTTPVSSLRGSFLPRPITPTHMRSLSVPHRTDRRGSVGSAIPFSRRSISVTSRSDSVHDISAGVRKYASVSDRIDLHQDKSMSSFTSKIPVSLSPCKQSSDSFSRQSPPSNNSSKNSSISERLGRRWDSTSCLEVRKLSEAEQSIAPLKSKNRQFVSRNLELSARNKQLQETLRELTVQYNKEKEEEQNIDPEGRVLRSTRTRNKEKRSQRKDIQNVGSRASPNLDTADYQNLYTHLQKEYTELQRAYQLLQTRIVPSGQDVEREEKNITYLKNKLQAAETKITDLESSLNQIDHSAATKKLIDEKQTVINLNLGLSEKIRVLEERDGRLRSELQDSKDQAELLEFRVLELEECQEKAQPSQGASVKNMKQTVDTGTETDTELIDSGCSSIQHSRCPSVATDEDIAELQRDFRNEKIHETQQKLHALVGHVQGSTSKSLLLQTVALFEALLTRIQELQQENQKLKELCEMNNIEPEDKASSAGANDDLVLEIEKLNQEKITLQQELKEAQDLIQYYKQNYEKLTQDMKKRESDLEKKAEVHRKLSDMQSKVEGDLKKQVNCLNQKLDATIVGCRSESEMHEESLLKVSMLERSIMGLKQCIDDLQSENNELREQLSAALEHHTTKSSGSLGSEFGSTKASSLLSDISDSGTQKTGSSGIGSDLSDSEADHLSLRSRSASPEKSLSGERFSESGMFEATNFVNSQTQTTDQYIKEIASLTEEVEKLTAFRDLVETRMVLPIPSSPANQVKMSSKQNEASSDKESTPVNEKESSEDELKNEISYLHKTLEQTRSELKQVIEDKCELEEAENDSRLRAQVSEQEALDLHDSIKNLEDELLVERKAIKHLRSELEIQKEKEDSSYNEIAYLELLTKQYEDKINMLEDRKGRLVNGLNLLVKGVTIWSFVHHNKYCIVRPLNRGLCFVNDKVYNLNHTDGLLNKIRRSTSLSTEDEPFSKKMRISCDDELKREKEELQLEVLKLKIEKEQLEKSEEKTYEEKIERIMTLEDKVAELFHEGKLMKDQFLREKTALKNAHEREMGELLKKENSNTSRLEYLQHEVDIIEAELESVEVNGEKNNISKVKFLIDNENKLTKEISEHEKKEYAFRETLAEADVIMANIEYNYTTKVKDLEEENNRLQQRISYHTETEQRLKQSLKTSGKNDSQSYGELLERLMETEKAELAMKEKVYYLEKSERELNLKLLEEQKHASDLKNEIKDQEDLMAQMENMETENKRLHQNMNRLKEIEFKYQEIQQSEDFLHGRVEELEQTENSLRETICIIEQSSSVKEKKMQDQINRLREEIQHQNNSASNYEDAYDRLRGQDDSLKMEIDNLKEKVTELTCELNQKSTQYQETEASLRSELNKARQNLQQTNNQLTEIDTINCQLRSNLSHAEQQVQEKNSQVDQLKHHLEQTNIQHGLQLQAKENMLQNIQDKFERVRRKSDEKELDEIARSEGGLLAVTKEVEDAALTVSECISCSPVLTTKLKDAAAQLSCLSTVICGQGDESRKMPALGELHRCESEEVLPQHDEFEPTFEFESMDNQELTELEESMLESQLSELQEKLGRMEAEMTIVSEESKDLQDTLESREAALVEKSQQLRDLTELVEHLTHNTEQEKQRTDKILKQLQSECEKLHEKDKYLSVFVEKVVPACSLSNQSILEALKAPPTATCDFSLDSLCTAILNGRPSSKKLVSDAEMKKIEELKNTSRDFRERSPISRPEINLTLLPPEDFRITRKVGSDGLLVAWKTPEDDEVTGYLIYVGGRVVQRVRSASRTKALLHGLVLEDNLSIVLHATNSQDELSDPVEVLYTCGMELPDQKEKKRGRATPVENGDKVI